MFYIFVVFVLCCFSLVQSIPIIPDESTSFKCGISPAVERYGKITNGGNSNKIMGGVVSPPHYWPWLTSLMYPKENPSGECTGEIIGQRWIITAQHCEQFFSDGFFNVGTNNFKKITNETRYEIKMSYALPEPNIDIVLVELSQNLKYGRDISPICISKNVKPKVGDVAVVAGFGTLYIEYDPTGYAGVDSEANHLLHEGLVTVKDFTKCTNLTRENEETAICAGGINRGVMPGDSGGPIMGVKNNKFYLYGSVSGGRAFQAGDDNLTVNEFDAYTIVSSHCDWIEAVTKGDVKCEK